MAIPKEEAESYVKKYMDLQDALRNSGALDQVTNEASRAYFSSNIISFVFEKYRVDALFSDNPNADALRIYYGAHDNGEPTIVIVSAQMNVENALVRNSTSSGGKDQWPRFKSERTGTGYSEFDIDDDPIY
jgi:hypothetical protein